MKRICEFNAIPLFLASVSQFLYRVRFVCDSNPRGWCGIAPSTIDKVQCVSSLVDIDGYMCCNYYRMLLLRLVALQWVAVNPRLTLRKPEEQPSLTPANLMLTNQRARHIAMIRTTAQCVCVYDS